jgi:hypothetical protein
MVLNRKNSELQWEEKKLSSGITYATANIHQDDDKKEHLHPTNKREPEKHSFLGISYDEDSIWGISRMFLAIIVEAVIIAGLVIVS